MKTPTTKFLFDTVAGPDISTLLKKDFTAVSPVTFSKIFRTPIPQSTYRGLLLKMKFKNFRKIMSKTLLITVTLTHNTLV